MPSNEQRATNSLDGLPEPIQEQIREDEEDETLDRERLEETFKRMREESDDDSEYMF